VRGGAVRGETLGFVVRDEFNGKWNAYVFEDFATRREAKQWAEKASKVRNRECQRTDR